jgi:hypothetical protein
MKIPSRKGTFRRKKLKKCGYCKKGRFTNLDGRKVKCVFCGGTGFRPE